MTVTIPHLLCPWHRSECFTQVNSFMGTRSQIQLPLVESWNKTGSQFPMWLVLKKI